MSVVWLMFEQMPQDLNCWWLPVMKWRIRDVNSSTLFSREELLTSLTHLGFWSARVQNYCELTAILEMKVFAAASVRSIRAPPLAASIMLLPIDNSLHKNNEWEVDRLSGDIDSWCIVSWIFLSIRRESLRHPAWYYKFSFLWWQLVMPKSTFLRTTSSIHSRRLWIPTVSNTTSP